MHVSNEPTNESCVNWNQYYTDCRPGDKNPFQGAISFDNIGLAWVAIFLVSERRPVIKAWVKTDIYLCICVSLYLYLLTYLPLSLWCYAGHQSGGLDGDHVLRARRPLFLGLDLLCPPHRGECRTSCLALLVCL